MGVPVGIAATRFSIGQIIRDIYQYFIFPMRHKYQDTSYSSIDSFVYLLTEEKSPGAYTKVTNYIQWIQEMIASHPWPRNNLAHAM